MAKKKSEDTSQVDGAAAAATPYVVLARKYRPQTFDDLIGQETMVQTLRNAFAAGRIAHGFMLTGVRGVGKTTTARILARALNYETDTVDKPTIDMPSPGRHCIEIMESRHPDVIEMDAASNTGVDNIREIIESARYRPLSARTKVFIIDEVHMLSKGAFNALLKTLEEPPGHVKFIFATTEVRKVPVTVLSRCQRFDLRRVDVPRLVQHLKNIVANEGAAADDDALTLIARAAEGSVRDALSMLDQAIATALGPTPGEASAVSAEAVRGLLGLADRGRVFDLLETLAAGDIATALTSLDGLIHDGADAAQVLADLSEAVHITARIKAVGPDAAGEGLALAEKQRAGALGGQLSMGFLSRLWQMLLKGLEEAGKAPNPVAAAQMVLIRIAHTADLPPPDEVIRALGGAPDARRSAAPAPSQTAAAPVATRTDAPVAYDDEPDDDRFTFEGMEGLEGFEAADDEGDNGASVQGVPLRPLNTFADIVALARDKRDAKLMIALEDQVSLVRFDGAAGAIDLYLLPGAPAGLANDLREKLNKWTGRRWVTMLSKTPGERPLGEVRRERDALEREALRKHPAVAAVLEVFPDAEINVRPLDSIPDDDSATG
ncbi:DNA polymerase III subunit gamma/tau [Hyphomicrobium sp.]|uniref:DNA polymerase III subunit gamma/tau n=1 Tax=Hyphomicrobium sp. TaxID=82 RepID=UPI002BB7AC6F|nr:DNA polymerase III subunit gamma/tau [Hyphomicrobium sp.]HRN88523.1 DNA polymerase III subunit gamma/tau [Hyphomicrobium sp.]HRQ26777.1 DNA polymerase III subunit gamma/tau [Hyphomicrobium sp.]